MVTPVVQQSALVLNQNYEPLNVCSVRRAFVLVFRGKAELLAEGDEPIHGVDAVRFTSPSVIRLRDFVRRPLPHVRLTRREVFARDNNRCQYCNRQDGDLTLDHVIPRRLGGRHEWENLVAACRGCNHRKGGRTPSEARMRLRRKPLRPVATPGMLFARYMDHYVKWRPFLRGWVERRRRGHPAEAAAAGGD